MNDYQSASYAAREATQRHGDNAVTWSLRAQANYGLGRFTDALYEARQATEIEPQSSTYHYNLGQVQEALGQWEPAIASYETVARLEPGGPTGKLGVASVLLDTERPADALRVMEDLHRRFPRDKTVGMYLGLALVGAAEKVPRVRGDGSYSVTSAEEIQRMRDLVFRAREATDEMSVRDAIRSIEQYLDRMDQRTVDVPVGNPVGYGCFTFFAIMIGFSSLVSGTGGGFLFGLVCLGVAALLDDRVKARALDELSARVRSAETGPFREYLHPFVRRLAFALDRLDRYEGPDPAFAASVRDEILDVLEGHGMTSVDGGHHFDAARHEAVGTRPSDDPPGTVLATTRRGYAHGSWVFRPAQVIVATAADPPRPPPMR